MKLIYFFFETSVVVTLISIFKLLQQTRKLSRMFWGPSLISDMKHVYLCINMKYQNIFVTFRVFFFNVLFWSWLTWKLLLLKILWSFQLICKQYFFGKGSTYTQLSRIIPATINFYQLARLKSHKYLKYCKGHNIKL